MTVENRTRQASSKARESGFALWPGLCVFLVVLVARMDAGPLSQNAQGQVLPAKDAGPANAHPKPEVTVVRRRGTGRHSDAKAQRPFETAVAAPAKVTFQGGLLTVHAENADFTEILRQVAQASGMMMDGSVESSRVYGDYGPADPLKVLTDLLAGSGYNFMMVGSMDDGAPRELLLTQKSGEPLPRPRPQTQQTQQELESAQEEQVGPGAITHVPPPPSEDPQVRMQQNMQRLQQMHAHQVQPDQPQ